MQLLVRHNYYWQDSIMALTGRDSMNFPEDCREVMACEKRGSYSLTFPPNHCMSSSLSSARALLSTSTPPDVQWVLYSRDHSIVLFSYCGISYPESLVTIFLFKELYGTWPTRSESELILAAIVWRRLLHTAMSLLLLFNWPDLMKYRLCGQHCALRAQSSFKKCSAYS